MPAGSITTAGYSTGAVTNVPTLIPQYWDQVLGSNLYPNLVFYGIGTERTIPDNFGFSIKIPRVKRKTGVVRQVAGSAGEYDPTNFGTCPLTSEFLSGTLKKFKGVYKHDDIVLMTSMSDLVDLSLIEISKDLALQMDTHTRAQFSDGGAMSGVSFRGGSGTPYATGVGSATNMTATDILWGVTKLRSVNNPTPSDGFFPGVFHPWQIFDIQSAMTGGVWQEFNKYASDKSLQHIYNAEVGRLHGCRIVSTTNITTPAAGTQGMSAGAGAGQMGHIFAPDAYYVTQINQGTAKTYVKQLGSGGTSDAVNEIATVGAKVFFTALSADTWSSTTTEPRIIRIVTGNNEA